MVSRIPTLIGITGGRGSGKDTAYKIIEEWSVGNGLIPARRAFADSIKWSFARIFKPNISCDAAVDWCDELKINSIISANGCEVTGREALQHFGFEAHREIFGDDFWLNQVVPLPDWRDKFSDEGKLSDICVVTDVRYNNEAQRIKEAGGSIWSVKRANALFDNHSSEQGITNSLVDVAVINADIKNYENEIYYLMELAVHRKKVIKND